MSYSNLENKVYYDALEANYFNEFPGEIIKHAPLFRNERVTEGVHRYNGKIWKEELATEIEGRCNAILNKMGVVACNRMRNHIVSFMSRYVIKESEFNLNAENLFVTENGVIDLECLKRVWEQLPENEKNIKELFALKDEWLFPHENYKENHLTTMAPIEIPDELDIDQFYEDINFIKGKLLKSLGDRSDNLEWLCNLLALCLTGRRTGDMFVNLYGRGGTGKTTFIKFLGSVFGDDYLRILQTSELFDERNSTLTKLYRSKYARIISVSEPTDSKINASFIKKLTGGSELAVGYGDIKFELNGQIIIDSNFLLEPKEVDKEAFRRRAAIIPFGPAIPEEDQEKDLIEKMKERKNSFFIELLYRFVQLNLLGFKKPVFSYSVLETADLFSDLPKMFYKTCCTSGLSTQNGKDYKLPEVLLFFRTQFYDYYEHCLNNLFFKSEQFHRDVFKISGQTLHKELLKFHRNIDASHAREIVFKNLILEIPPEGATAQSLQVERLVNCKWATDKSEALKIINEAAQTATITIPEGKDDEDFRDVMMLQGFPSFSFFNIVTPNKTIWENEMLISILNERYATVSSGGFVSIPEMLISWLHSNEVGISPQKATEILDKFAYFIEMCNSDLNRCMTNKEIRDILGVLFDLYIKMARKTLRDNSKKEIKL